MAAVNLSTQSFHQAVDQASNTRSLFITHYLLTEIWTHRLYFMQSLLPEQELISKTVIE
jgi:hypothetical protein